MLKVTKHAVFYRSNQHLKSATSTALVERCQNWCPPDHHLNLVRTALLVDKGSVLSSTRSRRQNVPFLLSKWRLEGDLKKNTENVHRYWGFLQEGKIRISFLVWEWTRLGIWCLVRHQNWQSLFSRIVQKKRKLKSAGLVGNCQMERELEPYFPAPRESRMWIYYVSIENRRKVPGLHYMANREGSWCHCLVFSRER